MEEEKTMTPEEKLQEYERIIEELMAKGTKKAGRILAGPDRDYYKILVDGGEIIAKSPIPVEIGDYVIVLEGSIAEKLPELLVTVEEDQVEFERIGWDDIGRMKSQVQRIRETVEYPIKYKKLYEEFKLRPSKGILLYGPSGCGKTMVAKAIASTILNSNRISKNLFIYLKGGELLSKWVGESENRIKNIFDSARKTYQKTGKRPVIFIDEAEAILPPRGSRTSSDVDSTIVPTFLSEMDGFEENSPFVILATNFKDRIDVAVQRPGRIDLKVYLGRPDEADCVDIYKIHLAKTPLAGNIEGLSKMATEYMHGIAKLKGEISGAFIEGIVTSSIENALLRRINDSKQKGGVNADDIVKAIDCL